MYPNKFNPFTFSLNPNLKHLILKGFNKHFVSKYGFSFRQKLSELHSFEDLSKKFQYIFKRGQLLKRLLEKPPESSNTTKNSLIKIWVHHCEYVFAQRLRRCQQMFTIYSEWWEEKALKDFLRKMKTSVSKRSRDLALASVAVYNWEQNRISLEELKSNDKEFEYITRLKENTICLACDPTARSDHNKSICKCGTSGKPTDKTYDNWTVFIEKKDLVVWRRLHSSGSGQYEYKVFGSYSDVTAEDFLNVQIDITYRKKWDNTAITLKQGETDPQAGANGDIVYWEMQWPRLFVNRDYVFNRRYTVDIEKKMIFLLSKSTTHPDFPPYPDKFRISDYWSCMVIKPYTELNKNGVEFVLTYYDNPGVNIPSSITTWVAMRAMPDFLEKLRQATKDYKQYCITEGTGKACQVFPTSVNAIKDKEKEKLDYCSFLREAKQLLIQHATGEFTNSDTTPGNNNKDNYTPSDNNTQQNKNESRGYLKYFHPLYYFQ